MCSKKIKIDLRTDQDGYVAGYIGEINQRALEIIPPADLRGSACFVPAFDLPSGVFRPPVQYPPGRTVCVTLEPPVTAQPSVVMTLEGYRQDGAILGKSHTVKLLFADAVTGPAWNLATQESLDAETTARIAGDTANAAAVTAEEVRAQAAELALASALSAETTTRAEADQSLQATIDAETDARIAGDTANAAAVTAEATRAQAAEQTLTSNLAAEILRATGAEITLTQNLEAAIAAAEDANQTLGEDNAALRDDIDNLKDLIAGKQEWLPAVPAFADLPATVVSGNVNYLCRVISDSDPSNIGVWQAIANGTTTPTWTHFSDNADFVDELELAEILEPYATQQQLSDDLAAEAAARDDADADLQQQIRDLPLIRTYDTLEELQADRPDPQQADDPVYLKTPATQEAPLAGLERGRDYDLRFRAGELAPHPSNLYLQNLQDQEGRPGAVIVAVTDTTGNQDWIVQVATDAGMYVYAFTALEIEGASIPRGWSLAVYDDGAQSFEPCDTPDIIMHGMHIAPGDEWDPDAGGYVETWPDLADLPWFIAVGIQVDRLVRWDAAGFYAPVYPEAPETDLTPVWDGITAADDKAQTALIEAQTAAAAANNAWQTANNAAILANQAQRSASERMQYQDIPDGGTLPVSTPGTVLRLRGDADGALSGICLPGSVSGSLRLLTENIPAFLASGSGEFVLAQFGTPSYGAIRGSFSARYLYADRFGSGYIYAAQSGAYSCVKDLATGATDIVTLPEPGLYQLSGGAPTKIDAPDGYVTLEAGGSVSQAGAVSGVLSTVIPARLPGAAAGLYLREADGLTSLDRVQYVKDPARPQDSPAGTLLRLSAETTIPPEVTPPSASYGGQVYISRWWLENVFDQSVSVASSAALTTGSFTSSAAGGYAVKTQTGGASPAAALLYCRAAGTYPVLAYPGTQGVTASVTVDAGGYYSVSVTSSGDYTATAYTPEGWTFAQIYVSIPGMSTVTGRESGAFSTAPIGDPETVGAGLYIAEDTGLTQIL
jgi:hypothetical protein